MAKREIIIELRVDQKTAVNDLGKAKVELINLKEAERALVKERTWQATGRVRKNFSKHSRA